MTLAEDIRCLLPELRQFGLMLVGQQDHADIVIMDCLQQIIEEPARVRDHDDTKIALYRMFIDELNDRLNSSTWVVMSDSLMDSLDEDLKQLNFTERQIFLLRHVGQFSLQETARIMDASTSNIEKFDAEIIHRLSQRLRR